MLKCALHHFVRWYTSGIVRPAYRTKCAWYAYNGWVFQTRWNTATVGGNNYMLKPRWNTATVGGNNYMLKPRYRLVCSAVDYRPISIPQTATSPVAVGSP